MSYAPAEVYIDAFDGDRVNEILDEWGVCVVKSHFTAEYSEVAKTRIVDWLEKLSPQLKSKWSINNLPYGPRFGMMQSLVGHCPAVWELRERLYPLFREIWKEDALLTSIDGASVHPAVVHKSADWPHIDQTKVDVRCVQGEVVLTDTTATFRCTPKSHKKHLELLKMADKVDDASNWLKLDGAMQAKLKPLFEHWQVPIHAPAGSVIFWLSNTIHSAKRNDPIDDGWRCVVYICQRPESHFTERQKKTLRRAATEGRTTNHWVTRLFPKRPGSMYRNPHAKEIEQLTDNPEQVVMPNPSPLLRKLTALEPWDPPKQKRRKC